MKRDFARFCAAAILVLAAGVARADVTISAHATAHTSCVANVCTATGAKAYLNAGDLETMLASASVTVKSIAAAPDIHIAVPLSWSSTFTLGLDSHRGVDVQMTISILANGGLNVTLNDGGSGGLFAVGAHGNVHFWSLAGSLVATNEAGGTLTTSYAAGQVTAVSNFGGIAGTNLGTLSQVYWDKNYTGAGDGFGCGSGSCTGATGLTHAEITAALPTGFDPAIWGLDPAINSGWPYLLANPPQ